MEKLTGAQLQLARPLFGSYTSNRSIIYSMFENQYDGCAYVDNIGNPVWAVLQTPFLQHFVAGEPTDQCASEIEEILFCHICADQEEQEIVVFSDSKRWAPALSEIFGRHRGLSDSRKIFAFSPGDYYKMHRPALPEGIQAMAAKRRVHPASHIDTWSVRLRSGDAEVCHCDALMVGDNLAEMDVCTEESFRGKGFATFAAHLLIEKLLEDGLTPVWSCWPFRTESQGLARKLGFLPQPDARAWIWMDSM